MTAGTKDALHEAIALNEASLDELFLAASRELAAMPVEQARAEVAKLVALVERVTTRGPTTMVDVLVATTRDLTSSVDVLVADAGTAAVELVRAAAPSLHRIEQFLLDYTLGKVLDVVVDPVLALVKSKVMALATACQIATGQPAHMDRADPPPPPAVELHAPAPAQAPRSGRSL